MTSITDSEILASVNNIQVFFELQHYQVQGLRDVFVRAVTAPIDYFFKPSELLHVLNGLSFELKKGTRLGIIGVNGCGKTTLCRCFAGMIVPQRGTIKLNGNVRAIFDIGTGVMPELTGRENAYLMARLFFPEIRNHKEMVEEAMEFSELGHFLDIPFKQYSKGMQARLMLSLISAKSTDILILDEVLDGADHFFQQKISIRMKNLIKNSSSTIFVSHNIDQIREICDQVLVLTNGKIGFLGNVEEGIQYYLSNPTKSYEANP